MLYKFVDAHTLKPSTNKMIVLPGNISVSNPREEHFIAAGYCARIYDPEPEYNHETQCLSEYYEDTKPIKVHYEVVEKPDPEPAAPNSETVPDLSERVAAIEEALLALLEM